MCLRKSLNLIQCSPKAAMIHSSFPSFSLVNFRWSVFQPKNRRNRKAKYWDPVTPASLCNSNWVSMNANKPFFKYFYLQKLENPPNQILKASCFGNRNISFPSTGRGFFLVSKDVRIKIQNMLNLQHGKRSLLLLHRIPIEPRKKPYYFPLHWLVNKDPYNVFL